jgi:hypothetical protein
MLSLLEVLVGVALLTLSWPMLLCATAYEIWAWPRHRNWINVIWCISAAVFGVSVLMILGATR